MTDNDKKLIEQARECSPQEWGKVADMEDRADTCEARLELKSIRCALYHREEYLGGCL